MKNIRFAEQLIQAAKKYDIYFVDIGARDGVTDDLMSLCTAVNVIAFEPEPTEAQRLQEVEDGRWRSMTVIPAAVSDTNGQATLYVPQSKQSASLLPHNASLVEEFGFENMHGIGTKVSIPSCTLDQLLSDGHLRKASYIKIDVEGGELSILKGATSVLVTVVAMRIEVSFLKQRIDQPLIWEVVAWLYKQGFDVVDVIDIHRWRRRSVPAAPFRSGFYMPYSKGMVSQCDLMFVRRSDMRVDIDQNIEAVLILAALGYFDLAIKIIREQAGIERHWSDQHGFDLEKALIAESRKQGFHASWANLRKSVRSLVPAFRAALFGLPFSTPRLPY
jgi:FkbM family methyltransferase